MANLTRRSWLAALCALFPGVIFGRTLLSPFGPASDPAISPENPPSPAPDPMNPVQASPRPTKKPAHWFTDVAGRSSFPYRTNNNFTGRKYFPQPMCGGVAAIDYDNDGRMDLFFTNGARLPELVKTTPDFYNCLLRNRGDGTFEDVTAKAGLTGSGLGFCFGVAVADYDNDGFDDIFICNAGANTLYHNNGNGTFTDVTAASGLNRKGENVLSVGAAWFDYNNDGLLDLIVTNYTVWTPQADKTCRMDETREEYCSPTVYKSVASNLYRNLGNGRFEDVTEASGIGKALGKGMGISVADFNGDGWMDIFVANDTEPNFLFINQQDGTFKESGLELGVAYNSQGGSVSGMGCDAADFDNDGWIDIVYNDLSGQVYGLMKNESGKAFTDATWTSKLGALTRSSLRLEHRLHRFRQRWLERYLFCQRRCRQPCRERPSARHHVSQHRRQNPRRRNRNNGAGLRVHRLPARRGVCRSQQRWIHGPGGNVAGRAATHPDEQRPQRKSLDHVRSEGPGKQSQWHRRFHQGRDRFRPRSL